MKKTVLFVILSLYGLFIYGQNEASNWYFGYNAAIAFDLNDNSITKKNDGQLNTIEGCSSISDNNGDLLFYTDGITIWNRNHDVMTNGNVLFGDPSSSQSAIIVPKPNTPNIYYIFTADDHNRNEIHYGLNYSEIDMTLSGGLGAVTNKNINLLPDCSEKLSAVLKDCFTKSIWVLTFASENGTLEEHNTFHAFEVSNLGVNPNSVKSVFPINITDYRGYLKLSPNGKKLASANASAGTRQNIINTEDRLFVYDFDSASGEVSNATKLVFNAPNNTPYGLEFSPNSNLLYVHASNDFFDFENPSNSENPQNHTSTLSQFNLTVPDIQNSQVVLDSRNLYRGALQLGPDGKIYRALSATYNTGLPYLGVIENPNIVGTGSNYRHNAIDLSPFNSSQGLPPFLVSFFDTTIDIIKNDKSSVNLTICDGSSYVLASEDIPGANYAWTLDGMPLAESDFDLEVFESGHYEVFIELISGDCPLEGQAFVNFTPNPDAFDYTLIQCDEDGVFDGLTTFNLNQANEALTGSIRNRLTKFYTDPARTLEIDGNAFTNNINPQIIYVDVINNETGCISFSELTLDVTLTDSNNAFLNTCDDDGIEDGFHTFNLNDAEADILEGLPLGLNVVYYKSYNDALLEENNLNTTYTNKTPYSETLYARVENINICYGISELFLNVFELPDVIIEDVEYYCLNSFPTTIPIDAGDLDGSISDYSYSWSTGENTYQININTPGDYKVTVINANGCSKDRTVTVETSNIATFEMPPFDVKDLSQNNSITVFVTGEGIYQYRLADENNNTLQPYQDSNIFENIFPGIYTVYVQDIKNNCGVVDKAVSVIGFPKFFTPNDDGVNDTWKLYGVSNMFQPNTKIQIFNRFGKLLKQISPLGEGFSGIINGAKLPTDDYWFSVKLQDGRVFKGHFALIN
ncbi:MAG: T9SS type B sorting domain-containing protein [Algibacter sp.]|uniref:T9SS type B sorting domain-containing protein n=1 Tax=Algibacter sp. TaxID=1872428 RepID=UPI00261D6FF0|nr:T9SS type B sorting domain-containing protein [Algibacter sp.]MDG1728393.1 T9SS type B sorting domain-containing protein [Algibacter sp.]MDG2179268.1 T9SS type B sorting domain-containing protein [Algibacter sp.]